MKNLATHLSLCVTLLLLTSIASAQSWSDRVAAVKRKRLQKQSEKLTLNHPTLKMRQTLNRIDLDQTPLRDALEWWKQTVGVAMLANWDALEQEGIDPNFPITLKLRNAPANVVLDLILEMASQETKVYHHETKWYVQILSREQLLKKTQVRMYDVRDLLVNIPQFHGAPKMGLSQALSSRVGRSGSGGGNSGGGGSGGGASGGGASGGGGALFGNNATTNQSNNDKEDNSPTEKDRAQKLIDLIRQTIEPDIWLANGGLHSSITFFKGLLVIRAPEFVHRQIGSASVSLLGNGRSGGQLDRNSQYQSGKASRSKNPEKITSETGKSKVSSVQSKSASQTVSSVAKTPRKD